MEIVISLRQLAQELASVSDERFVYLNRRTGEFVGLSEEELRAAESGEDPDDYPEWQRELIQQAKEVLETDDYVDLPSRFDIHEWDMMRRFCVSVEDPDTSEDLLDAIHGSGAFRRFKNMIIRRDLEDAWYRFRDRALAEIAVKWLEENGLAYTRDLELSGA
jgi:PAS domain-containing protein